MTETASEKGKVVTNRGYWLPKQQVKKAKW